MIKVVSRQTTTCRGRDGIEVTIRANFLWQLRARAITHLVSYRELEDALEGAGMRA